MEELKRHIVKKDNNSKKLRILIPKGRIFENVSLLFDEAGYPLHLADRTYRPVVNTDWMAVKIMKPKKEKLRMRNEL